MSGEVLAGREILATPPASDQLEVSVFGPGVGESILVHAGRGQWICVDSAKYQGRPWALYYLRQMGLDPAKNIRLIVASHWHSDHVDGLSEVVAECPAAVFACSRALRTEEFKRIVARYIVKDADRIKAPLKEMQSIFDMWHMRRSADKNYHPPMLAAARNLLDDFGWMRRGFFFWPRRYRVEVWSLSPSPSDELDAMSEFATLFVPLDQVASGIAPIKHNKASVVILIKAGRDAILLGSDLENYNGQHSGWNAIVGYTISRDNRSAMFKVPHHGSGGAFSQDVWNFLVSDEAVAVVTPYTPSGLPRAEEIRRLASQGRTVYATALPTEIQMPRSDDIHKSVSEATRGTIKAYAVGTELGCVRLRKRANGRENWSIELFGSATIL
jgi:beta-lactamase superfamily II metal-dependent hydrolase